MRGSVYYQATQLVKTIFIEGAKKEERINPNSENYKCIASYSTMETYRQVWENFFNYLLEHWNMKNCELITEEQVAAYFEYKIEYYPSMSYSKKINSALGKLEDALSKYSKEKYQHTDNEPIVYDFKIRQNILDNAREHNLIAKNYANRTYKDAKKIIKNLSQEDFKIAATIQLEGGARLEGVGLIKKNQLKGMKIEKITGKVVGLIETKEKGGKVGDILVKPFTYSDLVDYIEDSGKDYFKINKQKYSNDIKETCLKLGIVPKGSHGFRWTFAQNRVRAYQDNGYTYEQAIQGVSWEMKHFRASITEHYLGS